MSADQRNVAVVQDNNLNVFSFDPEEGWESVTSIRPHKKGKLTFLANDVAWNPHDGQRDRIATGVVNGNVVVYNLSMKARNRIEFQLSGHSRYVNRVVFTPTSVGTCANMLLSASQDGSVKLWDLREIPVVPRSKRGATQVSNMDYSSRTLDAGKGSVRDISVSNHHGYLTFAAAYENGNVCIWDIRKENGPADVIPAHADLVLSVDWHPEESNMLASGGRDKMLRVWDLETCNLLHDIQTTAQVAMIRWRPDHTSHLATCSSTTDVDIHVWDYRRKYIPVVTFRGHKDRVTAFDWFNAHHLASCSKDSNMIAYDATKAHHPFEHLNAAATSFNARGELLTSLELVDREFGQDMPTPEDVFGGGKARSAADDDFDYVGAYSFERVIREYTTAADTIDVAKFEYLASNYKLRRAPPAELCTYNSQVASSQGLMATARVWDMLGSILAVDAEEGAEDDDADGAPAHGGFRPSINVLSPWDDLTTDDPAFDVDDLTAAMAPRPSFVDRDVAWATRMRTDVAAPRVLQFDVTGDYGPSVNYRGMAASGGDLAFGAGGGDLAFGGGSGSALLPDLTLPEVDFTPMIAALFDHCVNQGDVQMCVALSMVVGDRLELDSDQVRDYFFSYIDVLQRLELWTCAADVISNCPTASIRALNQQSTAVNIACGTCNKAIDPQQPMCYACETAPTCVVCRVPVRGEFVWCQGCGHGGHVDHMLEWFGSGASLVPCPTGCGHLCHAEMSSAAGVAGSSGGRR